MLLIEFQSRLALFNSVSWCANVICIRWHIPVRVLHINQTDAFAHEIYTNTVRAKRKVLLLERYA